MSASLAVGQKVAIWRKGRVVAVGRVQRFDDDAGTFYKPDHIATVVVSKSFDERVLEGGNGYSLMRPAGAGSWEFRAKSLNGYRGRKRMGSVRVLPLEVPA